MPSVSSPSSPGRKPYKLRLYQTYELLVDEYSNAHLQTYQELLQNFVVQSSGHKLLGNLVLFLHNLDHIDLDHMKMRLEKKFPF